ncbi:MAG: putative glycerol-1-phosphate prenyltransferase [Vicingaceae bacterium]
MEKPIYQTLKNQQKEGKKMIALLIDPDKVGALNLKSILTKAQASTVDLILVGGSLLTDGDLDKTIHFIKSQSELPLILFPGSVSQISTEADGILYLSLLSSRNAEMIIGQQVTAAPYLRKTNLEVISTAYLLIDSGKQTTASYMSNSNPIPANKPEIAASTALAGTYLGMDVIYLDGGSGAENPVPTEMISKVKDYTQQLLFIGGGVNTIKKAEDAFTAGADVIVVGNRIEQDPNFLTELGDLKKKLNS